MQEYFVYVQYLIDLLGACFVHTFIPGHLLLLHLKLATPRRRNRKKKVKKGNGCLKEDTPEQSEEGMLNC